MTLTLTAITPTLTQVSTDATLQLYGSDFIVTSIVKLVSPEVEPIEYPLTGLTLIDSTRLNAVVAAGSIPIGFYNVVVENTDGSTAQLEAAFRISVNLPVRPFLTNNTSDVIQTRILSRLGAAPNGMPYDIRKGQVPWDMTAAHAPELERFYKRLDDLFPQGFAQYMGGALLDLRAEEHGVLRNPATFAKVVVEITASPGTVIPTNITFSTTATPNTTDSPIAFASLETGQLIFKAPETGLAASGTTTTLVDTNKAWAVDSWKGYSVMLTLGPGAGQWRKVINNTATTLNVAAWDAGQIPSSGTSYKLFTGVEAQAVVAGRNGNVLPEAINRLATPTAFVTKVSNPVAATGGINLESDRLFLSRFLLTVRQRSAGGNDTDYEIWARETDGVSIGAVSVIPLWNGYGTVKVVIVNSDNTIPDSATVSKVAQYIATRRPIGAEVTVEAAVAQGIDARFTLTAQSGFNLASVQEDAREAIQAYLNAQPVGGEDGFVLFYRVQEAAILNTEGIDTFNMYSTGYGIRVGAGAFSTNDISIAGTQKPVAGTITAV